MLVSRTYTRIRTATDLDVASGYIQTGKINRGLVLAYNRTIMSEHGDMGQSVASSLSQAAINAAGRGLLNARLYDGFWAAARGSQRASMALTALEARSSIAMIAKRATQIASSANSMRKGKVTEALHTLGYDGLEMRRYSKRSVIKDPSRYWLEANFAWSPLIEDIGKATKVMASTPAHESVSSSSSGSYYQDYKDSSRSINSSGTMSRRAKADMHSVNPNVLLANNLGLTNPAFVAWDLVPFSFVVDWFLPIGKFLNSFDAAYGINVSNACTSSKGSGNGFMTYKHGSKILQNISRCTSFDRKPGSPPFPSFADRVLPISGSLWRAATSVALAHTTLASLASTLKK